MRRALWLALAGTIVIVVLAGAPGTAGAQTTSTSSSTTTATQPACSDDAEVSTTTTVPETTSTTAASTVDGPCDDEAEVPDDEFWIPVPTLTAPTTTTPPPTSADPSVPPPTTSTAPTGVAEVTSSTIAPSTSVAPETVELLAAAQPANCDQTDRKNIRIGDPDYAPHLDRDRDGIACEAGGEGTGGTGQPAGDPLPDTGVETSVLLALAMIALATGGGSMTLAKRRAT